MPRYFAPLTKKEFEEELDDAAAQYGGRYGYPETPEIQKDMKVEVDFENWYSSKAHFADEILGIHTLSNGLTFQGCAAGGDWETPVTFIVYWDGKKLRAYVPLKGNPYNTSTMQAYGNFHDHDEEKYDKSKKGKQTDDENKQKRYKAGDLTTDWPANGKMMLEDIKERIQPSVVVKKNPVKVKAAKNPSIGERIEALTFYGTGDEGVELFRATCHYCYLLIGLGYTNEAEIVYGWAKEMAEHSFKWVKENLPEDLDDNENGQWG